MQILIATSNEGKFREYQKMFASFSGKKEFLKDITFISLNECINKCSEPIENGQTYAENAKIKAKAYYDFYKIPVMTDDSGLEVELLDGAPGVYSARFGDVNSHQERRDLVRKLLKDNFPAKASFHCAICFYDGNEFKNFDESCDGYIIDEERGNKGFGYDPIFYFPNLNKTFAEIDECVKNQVSHRGKAFSKFLYYLAEIEHEKNIKSFLASKMQLIFKTEDVKIKNRILEGMSNYTYVLEINEKLYVVRYSNDPNEVFVKRNSEKYALSLYKQIFNEEYYIYLDDTGLMVTEYYDGICLKNKKLTSKDYQDVSKILHDIHDSKLKINNDNFLSPLSKLFDYETKLKFLGFSAPIEYQKAKEELLNRMKLLNNRPLTFVHGDSQKSNFIVGKSGLKIFDFEYANLGDPLIDVACFGNNDITEAFELLKYYDPINYNESLEIVKTWIAFYALQWYIVASYKDLIGASIELNFNFLKIADDYLKRAIDILF